MFLTGDLYQTVAPGYVALKPGHRPLACESLHDLLHAIDRET